MNKVIQLANLLPDARFKNSQCGRVYFTKGISPCLNTCGGGAERTEIFMDKAKARLRYAIGRTNHDPNGGYGTSKFHVNPYSSCVTAIQMSNRRQWIVEIKLKDTSSGNPTMQVATSPTTTLSRYGRVLWVDAQRID